MGYYELREAVLDLHRIACSDGGIDVGPTWTAIKHLAAELRGADLSAVVATESGPVDLAPSELDGFRDTLADFFASVPEGFTVAITNNRFD